MTCCEAIHSAEAMEVPEREDRMTKRRNFELLSADILEPGSGDDRNLRLLSESPRPTELRQLADHVRQFTSRRLSYLEDIVHAFRGLLSRVPFQSFWGIPIALYDTAVECKPLRSQDVSLRFLRGLYWLPSYKGKRKSVGHWPGGVLRH